MLSLSWANRRKAPEPMREYYVSFDETKVADRVFEAIQAG
jgi:hypothetical protein